jgi:7-carboxy-7-deazaguanine synthase
LPVPSGNLPLGSEDAGCTEVDVAVGLAALAVPSGWQPDGTGRLPVLPDTTSFCGLIAFALASIRVIRGHPSRFNIVTLRRFNEIVAVSDTLVVNEIYLSLQGESTFAGLPCVFVRLTACNLRCSYCDTAYAFTEGKKMSVADVRAEVLRLAGPFPISKLETRNSKLPLVELTGGEPLLQPNSLPLMQHLCDDGFTVLLETSGAPDISPVDPRVRRIMDLKCPSSGEVERNCWENLAHLKATDEIKFVIGTVEDYEWAKQQIVEHQLARLCPLLVSWMHPLSLEQQDKSLKPVPPGQTPISRRELAERIIADALPVRFQAQLHKLIWPPERRGV